MILIVAILIRNSKGEYFVTKRKNTKRIDPGLFGIGAGGHMEDNETPDVAAARELFEETGIATPLTPLFSFDFHDGDRHQTDHWFETRYDGNIPRGHIKNSFMTVGMACEPKTLNREEEYSQYCDER